jgi:tyrosine-protein kinase Etk/Wzc
MQPFLHKAFGQAEQVTVEGRSVRTNMITLLAPMAAISEAYRHLYTRLQLGIPDRVVETILITSPEAESGKSTTALNLALTVARTNRRTIVVDADMRRPVVHTYLGFEDGPVLQDVLRMDMQSEAFASQLDKAFTGYDNLYAITVRTPVETPLELLVSPAMRTLIETLKQHFDMIIFDSPPLLLASDATLLAPLFDATVVVTAAGHTHAEALQQTQEELAEAGAHVMGVVLNKYDPATISSKHTYGYRQRHYANYYYTKR